MTPEPEIIPQAELDEQVRLVRSHPEYASEAHVTATYRALGLEVLADPFAADVSERVARALGDRKPLSVIRIGDGEANILTFGVYPRMPTLDRHSVTALLRMQEDHFAAGEAWMITLRDMMLAAISHADIVGVKGMWRGNEPPNVEQWIESWDPRGLSGTWRTRDYMFKLARAGLLRGKTIASAHLYFGVIGNLPKILTAAERTILITTRTEVAAALRGRFPDFRIDHLPLGARRHCEDETPDFLSELTQRLPDNLEGVCCLIGAGPWAEFYCMWIRQRGGVAVDVGSGFDVMAGMPTRPVHETVGAAALRRYAVLDPTA